MLSYKISYSRYSVNILSSFNSGSIGPEEKFIQDPIYPDPRIQLSSGLDSTETGTSREVGYICIILFITTLLTGRHNIGNIAAAFKAVSKMESQSPTFLAVVARSPSDPAEKGKSKFSDSQITNNKLPFCKGHLKYGYGYGYGYDCGLWHHAPLESVQWPSSIRFSTNGITSSKVIPLKTPPFGCKYSTGEDHIVCQGCSYFCQIRNCT